MSSMLSVKDAKIRILVTHKNDPINSGPLTSTPIHRTHTAMSKQEAPKSVHLPDVHACPEPSNSFSEAQSQENTELTIEKANIHKDAHQCYIQS